jgi:hypothetical protein
MQEKIPQTTFKSIQFLSFPLKTYSLYFKILKPYAADLSCRTVLGVDLLQPAC